MEKSLVLCQERKDIKNMILEKDIWIGDTGASTHMSNLDEGIFDCQETVNQYIKVSSGERLQIMKKGCKRCCWDYLLPTLYMNIQLYKLRLI